MYWASNELVDLGVGDWADWVEDYICRDCESQGPVSHIGLEPHMSDIIGVGLSKLLCLISLKGDSSFLPKINIVAQQNFWYFTEFLIRVMLLMV